MNGSLALMELDDNFHPLLLEAGREAVGSVVLSWAELGLVPRIVRGRKMRTLMGLFDEFAAALQFPPHFGENWAAFDECLEDLHALASGDGYVVVITQPELVLVDSDAGEFLLLADSLESAASVWGQPVDLGEWWDRPAVPFHVMLAGDHHSLRQAIPYWSSAGCTPRRMD